MAKLGVDLREIQIRGRGRRKRRDPDEARVSLIEAGWKLIPDQEGQEDWAKDLGSILKCPVCDHPKCRRCRKQLLEDTPPEWSSVRHQENAAHFNMMKAADLDPWDEHYLRRCCACGFYTMASLWWFRTKQPDGYHSTQIDTDDAGAQVSARQKRLVERAVLQDAVSEEVNRVDRDYMKCERHAGLTTSEHDKSGTDCECGEYVRPNEKEQADGQD